MHPLRLQRRNSDCILSLSYAYSNYVKVWGIISLNFDNVLKYCLFNLILYVPSTIFQLNRDGSSWVEFISNVRQLFAADDFSRQHFQMHFFLGALRVKGITPLLRRVLVYIYICSQVLGVTIRRGHSR